MKEFIALRAKARERRDKVIAEARREYEYQLVQIAKLEQDLLGKVSSRHKSISAAVDSVIPRDRSFTTVDVMTGLEAMDPTRVWRKRSVDFVMTRLRERGIIKRLKRASIHEPAVYARSEAPVKPAPLADMTLLQVIGKVLAKPMTSTEVVVAVLEAGYETAMGRNNLRNHVVRELGRAGFKSDGGKWQP